MYALLIDTHNDLAVVCLYKDSQVLTIKKLASNQSHSNNLMVMISEVLEFNNLNPKDLNEVFVVAGPGSFTGSRIGVTVAKTFAYALNIPIKVISSLEQKAISSNSKDLKVCIESDKNGCFIGLFQGITLQNEMFYLSKKDFDEYIKTNEYAENIVDDIELNYDQIYKFISALPSLNPHEVKPLYVKVIEVLND